LLAIGHGKPRGPQAAQRSQEWREIALIAAVTADLQFYALLAAKPLARGPAARSFALPTR